MSQKRAMRALVLRAPGINCDRETAYACRLAGFEVEQLHINSLLQAPERLLDYDFLVLSGGFSYGDDLGAGTLLAKNLTVHLGTQLRQFIDEGRPVLGICNGFQVLVRAGLLPNNSEETPSLLTASLTDNASAQFECRWVRLSVQSSNCIFMQDMTQTIELPVAHGEGQFVLADAARLPALQVNGQVPLVYGDGSDGVAYPDNPNGSLGNIAGVCNARGNVLGLMPHPERYVSAMQHPQRRGTPDGQGDGLSLFKNAHAYAQKLASTPKNGTPKQTSHADTVQTGHREQTSLAGQPEQAYAYSSATKTSYAASGVNISAAETAKRLMKVAVSTAQGPEVLAGMGAFAGALDAQSLQQMRRPALVASTDGVGTKTLLAEQSGRFDSIGYDLVNHSVNDLLTQGAKPLFFMDYLAMGKLNPVKAATIVRGIAEACAEVGCSLLGGETAEMPDVYLQSAFDLAGTIVGVVEQDEMVDITAIAPGDILLGLPSNGLHTNGYSLARRIFAPYALDTVFPELGEPLVDALLRPHRCYLREIERIREYIGDRGHSIKGMAHITGGGFAGNVSRILPMGVQAVIETKKWRVPQLFQLLARLGRVSSEEMYQTFNMGVGMVLVLSPKGALEARCVVPELVSVGYITQGEGVVVRL